MEWNIPSFMREHPWWVLWDGDTKMPMAPWNDDGEMRATKWKGSLDESERPERSLEFIDDYLADAAHDIYADWRWKYPPDDHLVRPTVLLPHEERNPIPDDEPPLMFVDLDDTRNEANREMSDGAKDVIERLNSYTELSISGEGYHVFVRAEIPGNARKVVDTFDEDPVIGDADPGIELYNFGRFTGCTWNAVDAFPAEVVEAQDAIDDIVSEYDLHTTQKTESSSETEDIASSLRRQIREINKADTNPYHSADVVPIANTGRFGGNSRSSTGGEVDGPHPAHGAHSGSEWDEQSTNTTINAAKNQWYCRLHDTGGGPLSLAATIEGSVSCPRSKEAIYNPTSVDDYVAVYRACNYLRQNGLVDWNGRLPYNAVIGIIMEEARAVGDEITDAASFIEDNVTSGKVDRYRTVYQDISR